jgi:hypothetical protein
MGEEEMNLKNICNIRALAGAMGLAAAMLASSASAGINWGSPITLFEDDDLDFLIEANGETDGILSEGDVLVAILELNTANGSIIGPQELTGLAVIEVLGFADLDGQGGANDIIFGPASLGFNAITGLNVVGGGAGEGAIVSFWLDPTPDLVIDAGAINNGTETCQDMMTCIAQASDGNAWLTAGFAEAADFWVALNANTNTNFVFASPSVFEFGAVNTGLSILDNQTGQNLALDSFVCAPICGGDGSVDLIAGGSVKGGANGGANGGEWIATSDFDMQLAVEMPAPGTLALLGLGLLGLGSARRRKG